MLLETLTRPLFEQDADTLVDLAVAAEVEPDAMPSPDPTAVEADPVADGEAPALLPEERRNLLQDEQPGHLAEKLVAALSDEELRAMPVVADHERRREHRADLEAAALGAPVEAEREEAARARASEENEVAPTLEDVQRLAAPPDAWDPRVAQAEDDPVAMARWRFLYEHGDPDQLSRELAEIMQAQADEEAPPPPDGA